MYLLIVASNTDQYDMDGSYENEMRNFDPNYIPPLIPGLVGKSEKKAIKAIEPEPAQQILKVKSIGDACTPKMKKEDVLGLPIPVAELQKSFKENSIIGVCDFFSSNETKSQVSFTDPTSSVVIRSSCCVKFSLKRLLLLKFSSDFDQTWYI